MTEINTAADKGQIQHFVMFWLKPQLTKTEIADFANFFRKFKTHKIYQNIKLRLSG